MKLARIVVVCTALVGCSQPKATPSVPPSEAEAPAAPEPSASEPTEPTPEAPVSASWWTPLPAVSLEPLSDAEQAAARECLQTLRAQGSAATSADLLVAARCLQSSRAFGQEIRVLGQLLHTHPRAPEAPEALVSLASRYEQLDRHQQALEMYERYLRIYGSRDDALALGKRAVCLARSLDDDDTAQELLATLEKHFGRHGYEQPDATALAELCAKPTSP